MGVTMLAKRWIYVIVMVLLTGLLCSCASSGSSSASSQTATSTATEQALDKKPKATVAKSVKNGRTLAILPVTFLPGIKMHDVVREQCLLPEKLSGFIRDNAQNQYDNVIVDASRVPAGADVLKVQIIKVLAPKGGGWSGPKFLTVKGSLKRSGALIGSFSGKRTSMGGAFGVFKGTCDILGRCTKTLGQDIALWLQDPKKNSTLGNKK